MFLVWTAPKITIIGPSETRLYDSMVETITSSRHGSMSEIPIGFSVKLSNSSSGMSRYMMATAIEVSLSHITSYKRRFYSFCHF